MILVRRISGRWAAALLCAALLQAPRPAPAAEPVLEKVVVLMRHGVRPQSDIKDIAPYAGQDWPAWSVPDGELTLHGRLAAAQLGLWGKRQLTEAGLFPAQGCPAANDVFAWANSDRARTVDTANTVLDAMFPGCALRAGHLALNTPDPLFMASESELGRMDPEQAKAAILERMGGSFDRPRQQLAALLAQMQTVLQCCSKPVCQAALSKDQCGIADLPWSFEPAYHGRAVAVRGPMDKAATIAQILLLQYAEGMPQDRIGWGRAPTAADVIRLSEIRKIKYEYYERVPYIARRGVSNMARQIAMALEQPAGLQVDDPALGPPPAKLTLFVGSDTQIAELAALLDLHWQTASYLADETPPDGGLVFQVLRDRDSNQVVLRLGFLAQTLEQLRSAAPLNDANPPHYAPIDVPGCTPPTPRTTCTVQDFTRLLRSRLDPTAMGVPSYRKAPG